MSFQLLLHRRIEADCNGTFDTGVVQQADEALVSLDATLPVLANLQVVAIRPDGRCAGQFVGDRDSWASRPGRIHPSRGLVAEPILG